MKECKHCGTEMKKKAKICPNCKKKQTNPIVRGICIFVGLILIIAGLSSLSGNGSSSDENKCYATLDEFNSIQNGMTYDEAKEIIGCEGTVNSDTNVSGYTMTIYSWYGEDGISNMNINVSDGKITNKTQIGLK